MHNITLLGKLQSKLNPSRKHFAIQYACKLCLASGYLNSYNSTYNSNSVHTYTLGFNLLIFPTDFFYVNNSYGKCETGERLTSSQITESS